MLKPVPVDLKADDLSAALKEATKNASEDGDPQYLCRKDQSLFMDTVSLLAKPDWSMKKNCDKGCLYVDWVKRKECVPIHLLDEMFYIEGGDYM